MIFVLAASSVALAVVAPVAAEAQSSVSPKTPTKQPRGYTGSFKAVVTEGFYYGYEGEEFHTQDLVGMVFSLDWRTSMSYNAPAPTNFQGVIPYPILDRLIVNKARMLSEAYTLYAESSDNPYHDRGHAYEDASFFGSEKAGTFLLSYNSNDQIDSEVEFSFEKTRGRAAGSGRIATYASYNISGVDLRFNITGGRAFAIVPEPATWAMMIGGFGMVGSAMRRRTRVNVAFA